VLRFNRLRAAAIEKRVAAAANMGSSAPSLLSLREPFGRAARLPWGFAHDFKRSRIGHGPDAFARARLAFQRWAMFDLGWVRVANLEVTIRTGQTVAVEARTLGLYTLNLSRIREAALAAITSFAVCFCCLLLFWVNGVTTAVVAVVFMGASSLGCCLCRCL
jgi:hypothetical protein